MLTELGRFVLRAACRSYPRERGKFKILNEIYFKYLAPQAHHRVKTSLSYDITMELDISEFLQAHLYLYGSYELPTVKLIRRLLSDNDVSIDVGAQIGYLSLVMGTAAKQSTKVYSFEPEGANIVRFNTNIALNNLKNVELIRNAVSNFDGTLKLYMSKDHNAGTHSTVFNEATVSHDFVEVPAITLDHFVSSRNISKLRLLKIDVEGGELEVIQGAMNTLKTLKPVVIMEMCDAIQEARGFSTREFKTMMLENGFVAHKILDDGEITPVTLDALHPMDNLAFVHRA